ncbi:hypothetical protein K435DRAFT_872666 [Dendrothele bispora CBS 962.96]|uniref:Uncharacterized protein n=1 Tax=Dendrothele bispora (strain CBS 962.96) TaxID=1314807 RepID=A0A4S8L130_DENBC|nr:hypothetical protein K435DRAFT_872666 [Dendrothele bispora CBS 962.96]
MFVESAALYMIWTISFLISYGTHTNIQLFVIDLGPALTGIACVMITIRAALGYGQGHPVIPTQFPLAFHSRQSAQNQIGSITVSMSNSAAGHP